MYCFFYCALGMQKTLTGFALENGNLQQNEWLLSVCYMRESECDANYLYRHRARTSERRERDSLFSNSFIFKSNLQKQPCHTHYKSVRHIHLDSPCSFCIHRPIHSKKSIQLHKLYKTAAGREQFFT